jgi:two-component system, OmpR family, sensor kinase
MAGTRRGRTEVAVSEPQIYAELSRLNNELVTLQREVLKQNQTLERLHAQKDRFIGMAAHDLRTPLGVILTYAEFLETDAAAALTDEQREFIIVIKRTSKFMLGLIDHLLDASVIESGQLVLEHRPVDLSALVRRVVTLNRALASRKGVGVEFEGQDLEITLMLDAEKIEQVLNNLIGNAVKFSEPGQTVRVACVGDEECVTVSVAYAGRGIPPDAVSTLFQPFTARPTKGTGGEKGIGLGLAIVRRIVQGHGGQIRVDTEPGRGSTFSFDLPVVHAGATRAPAGRIR